MSTIDSRSIIRTMLENNGFYPGDPQCNAIYQYENNWGKTTWAVYWTGMYCDITESPHVHNPVLLFDKHNGLSQAGEDFLTEKSPSR